MVPINEEGATKLFHLHKAQSVKSLKFFKKFFICTLNLSFCLKNKEMTAVCTKLLQLVPAITKETKTNSKSMQMENQTSKFHTTKLLSCSVDLGDIAHRVLEMPSPQELMMIAKHHHFHNIDKSNQKCTQNECSGITAELLAGARALSLADRHHFELNLPCLLDKSTQCKRNWLLNVIAVRQRFERLKLSNRFLELLIERGS